MQTSSAVKNVGPAKLGPKVQHLDRQIKQQLVPFGSSAKAAHARLDVAEVLDATSTRGEKTFSVHDSDELLVRNALHERFEPHSAIGCSVCGLRGCGPEILVVVVHFLKVVYL